MKDQIEELAKKLRAYCYDIELNDNDDCRRLADFIIDTLGYRKQSEKYLIKENGDILPIPHHSEWISVVDGLPHELKKPILVTDGEKVIVAYRNWLYRSNSTGELRCPANYGNGMKVTHWMPLPEAPKGGAE